MQGKEIRVSGSSVWAMMLGMGVVLIILGLVVVANIWESLQLPRASSSASCCCSSASSASPPGRSRGGGWMLAPIVAIVGGVILLFWPGLTLKALAVIVGLTLIAWGAVQSGLAIASAREGRSGMLLERRADPAAGRDRRRLARVRRWPC